MTTLELLQLEFGGATAPLLDISAKYLGIGAIRAGEYAKANRLPIPCYRLGSRKSPWLVSLIDLADHIDRRHQEALTDWEAGQVIEWPIPRQ